MIIDHMMRVGFLDLRIFRPCSMQYPDALRVGEIDQTSVVVAIDRGYTIELASDFGMPRVGEIENSECLLLGCLRRSATCDQSGRSRNHYETIGAEGRRIRDFCKNGRSIRP